MFSGHLLFAVLMEGWVLHDPHPLLLSLVNMHVQVASRFQLSPCALNSFWCIIRPNRFNLKMEIFIKFSSENRSYITKIKKKNSLKPQQFLLALFLLLALPIHSKSPIWYTLLSETKIQWHFKQLPLNKASVVGKTPSSIFIPLKNFSYLYLYICIISIYIYITFLLIWTLATELNSSCRLCSMSFKWINKYTHGHKSLI